MSVRFSAVAAGILAGALLWALPADAQQNQAEPGAEPAQEQPKQQLRITRELVDAYIRASIDVSRIRGYWKAKIDGEQDETEKTAMIETAKKELTEAVENAPGITKREYAIILHAARQNEKLANLIKSRYQELRSQQHQPQTQ